jgi:hypothetical protein
VHWLLGFVLLLLALGTLRTVGCGDESPCGDCGDGNTCTRDFCDSFPRGRMEAPATPTVRSGCV